MLMYLAIIFTLLAAFTSLCKFCYPYNAVL